MKIISDGHNDKISWSFGKNAKSDSNLEEDDAIFLYPNHSGTISIYDGEDKFIQADGIITNKKASLIMKTADCVPIIVWWDNSDFYGVLHVGYKGLIRGVANNFYNLSSDMELPSNNANFIIGPSICTNCYVHDTFGRKVKWHLLKIKYSKFCVFRDEKYLFDLTGAFINELKSTGFDKKRIKFVGNYCTNCKLESSRHYHLKEFDIITSVSRSND